MQNLNLDVDTPDKVAAILRAAAKAYHENARELQSAWDRQAGKPWARTARVLERAAAQVDKIDMPRRTWDYEPK